MSTQGFQEVQDFHPGFRPSLPPAMTSTELESFEQLFKVQKTKLSCFVKKHLKHTHSIEDIVQQTFIEAFRSWTKFRGDSKPETWLYGIAMNVVRNNVTRTPEYRYQFEDADNLGEQLDDELAEDPLAIMMRGEMIQRVRIAIEQLPESMAIVVQMIAIDGYSYEDTAAELMIPVGTVRSRLSRARETIKDFLS